MSDMNGNPYQHFEEATALLADAPGQYEIEKSKALAALALAYEQRTANLIALWSNPQASMEDMTGNPVTYSLNDEVVGKVLQEISERLDLL